MKHDDYFMTLALQEAEKALEIGEVPIGAVVVYNNEVIASGYNLRETSQTTLSHAELIAINEENKKMGSWRLENCTLCYTLEHGEIGAGASVQSRIRRVVYGASDPKYGCAGTLMNLLEEKRFNHQVEVERGILEVESSSMLRAFFKQLRRKKK